MKPFELLTLGLLGSTMLAYYLFNYTGDALGPYGGPSDVYHEVILAGLLFLTFLFALMVTWVRPPEE